MNTKLKIAMSALLLSLVSCISFAADIDEGKSMYEEGCVKCHDSSVFTRKDRKMTDLDALKKQVHRCVTSQGYSWFEEDEENVVAYLSETFYKFSEKKNTK